MADKDTTKPGVSDESQNNDENKTDREETLDSIAENAKKTRMMEEAGVDINNPMEVNLALEKIANGEDPDPNAGLKDPYEDEEEDLSTIPADEDEELVPVEEPEMITVKINGVEKDVLKSDVDAEGGVRAYQKNRSADEKMRQAAEERKRIEAKEREIAQREINIAQREQALNKNTSSEPSTDVPSISEEARLLTEKMYSGDEEQTAEAVQTILERASTSTTPQLDTETIVNQTAAQVQWQNEVNSAKAKFASEFSDIDSNPEYRDYADQATVRIMAENPHWTPTQIITEAGEQARLKFRKELAEKAEADAESKREREEAEENESRLNNKRATDNVKGTDAKPAKKPVQKARTPSDIVKNMQQNRSHSSI
mgnify:CR=1 FL=1